MLNTAFDMMINYSVKHIHSFNGFPLGAYGRYTLKWNKISIGRPMALRVLPCFPRNQMALFSLSRNGITWLTPIARTRRAIKVREHLKPSLERISWQAYGFYCPVLCIIHVRALIQSITFQKYFPPQIFYTLLSTKAKKTFYHPIKFHFDLKKQKKKITHTATQPSEQ